jgi:glucose-6-phosphate 1-dehydrogenase
MEPPAAFEAGAIHNEKVKVMRALRPFDKTRAADVVRGQYGGGQVQGEAAAGYREEEGVDPGSVTETYVAIRLAIENWRWAGTPFYLRTGKRLPRRASEICVQFNRPPLSLFESVGHQRDRCDIGQARPNQLLFRIQPDDGISLSFASKAPGMEFQLQTVQMDFDYRGELDASMPEAYERLLLDALRGDSTLFTRADEVEYAWRFVDSIRKTWSESAAPEFPNYAPGDWGPAEANRLFHGRHCSWRRL